MDATFPTTFDHDCSLKIPVTTKIFHSPWWQDFHLHPDMHETTKMVDALIFPVIG